MSEDGYLNFLKLPQKIVFLSIYYSILFCYHK